MPTELMDLGCVARIGLNERSIGDFIGKLSRRKMNLETDMKKEVQYL
jgi:hypothetical protein